MKQIRARLFFTAAIMQVLVAIGHVIGHFAIPRPANATERKLIVMMSSYQKEVAGGQMSILDSYDGLNVCYGIFFLLAGAVNLCIVKQSKPLIEPISLFNALAMGSGAILSLIYFFWIPVVYFGVTCILFTIVYISSYNHRN